MSQTLAEMASEAAVQFGDTSTALTAVFKAGIRRRYARVLQRLGYPETNRTINVTVAAGESTVGIPIKGAAVRSVFNSTRNCQVQNMTQEGFDSMVGDLAGDSGAIRYYVNEGHRGVYRSFTTSDLGLFIVSTEAADVGTIRVTGYNDPDGTLAGQPFTATASLSGTTPVSIYDPGTLDGVTIETFTKSVDTVGVIFLQGNSGADEAGALGPTERSAQYTWLRFDSAADTATSLRVNCRLRDTGLQNDEDVPILRGIEHILVEGAIADGLRRHQQHAKARLQENLFMSLLDDYINLRMEDSAGVSAEGATGYRETWMI